MSGAWSMRANVEKMVNGAYTVLCLYRERALHSPIHIKAHREQLGVLAQGLFDTNSGGARDRTGNLSRTLRVPMMATLPLSHCRPCATFNLASLFVLCPYQSGNRDVNN